MSKLAKNLQTFLLEKNKPQENKAGVLNVTAEYDTRMMPAYTTYKMVTTVGCVFRVHGWEAEHLKADLRAAREREARDEIIHAVFGEFREPLLVARRCAMLGDTAGACQAIAAVLDSMFNID